MWPSVLGAALKHKTPDGLKTIAFASKFLNSTEERYSAIELELLGIIWSIDYFKYYLYGKNFTVITDHRALLLNLKEHRSNKIYNSRLFWWIYRLLPYNFTIEHISGEKMGLVDYIFGNPFAKNKKFQHMTNILFLKFETHLNIFFEVNCTQQHIKVTFTFIFCKSVICAANTNFNKKQFTI